jgi:hypothetical protein
VLRGGGYAAKRARMKAEGEQEQRRQRRRLDASGVCGMMMMPAVVETRCVVAAACVAELSNRHRHAHQPHCHR